jgi:hypothetical protein
MRYSDRARGCWARTERGAFSSRSRVWGRKALVAAMRGKRQGKLPRAQAGSTHRVAYFRLGGEAISRSQWNDGYSANSGPSRGDPCRGANRPFATFPAWVPRVRPQHHGEDDRGTHVLARVPAIVQRCPTPTKLTPADPSDLRRALPEPEARPQCRPAHCRDRRPGASFSTSRTPASSQ